MTEGNTVQHSSGTPPDAPIPVDEIHELRHLPPHLRSEARLNLH